METTRREFFKNITGAASAVLGVAAIPAGSRKHKNTPPSAPPRPPQQSVNHDISLPSHTHGPIRPGLHTHTMTPLPVKPV